MGNSNPHKKGCSCCICSAKNGLYVGKNHPGYKKSIHKKCRVCGDSLKSKIAKHCRYHMYLLRKNPKVHCTGCGVLLSKYAFRKGKVKYSKCRKCCRAGVPNPSQSLRMSGKNNPMFGKIAHHGKRIFYNGVRFRSKREAAFAEYLDRKKVVWEYEPKVFDLGDSTYTPDFYTPMMCTYIEFKGFWRGPDKEKFELFKKLYPKVKILLVMDKYFRKLLKLENP